MKYLILTALLLAALPARAGLVAEFLFDGDVQDSSGNANHALFLTGSFPSFGTFTTGRDGTPNGALLFNGTNQYLNIAQTSGLPLTQHTDFTITGWVKGPANQIDKRIFSEGSASDTQPLYNLGTDLNGSNNRLAIFIRGNTGSGPAPVSHHQPAGTLYDDTWHHFTVIDRNGTLSVYIDGVLQTGSPTYTRVPLTANTTTLGGILRATPGNFFAGALDDVRFYDSADINLTVTNTNDSGPGSLREAITLAPDGATITFEPTALDGETITLTSGQLLLDKEVTIDASALSTGPTISGNNASRIFDITSGNRVVIDSLNLTLGLSDNGGAIRNNNGGKLTLNNTTIFGNSTTGVGSGGGIRNEGTLEIYNSTLAENSTSISGGAIRNDGTLMLSHSTITLNSGGSAGGGGIHSVGVVAIQNSIIANNSGSVGPDIRRVSQTITPTGTNLIGDNDTVTAEFPSGAPNANGDLVGTAANPLAPLLAPLGDYGGPTFTMPPLPGSPAIDAALGFPGATDQRGLPIGDYVYENDFATADLGGATVFTNIADLLSPPVQPETGTVADGSFLFTGEVSNQVAALVLPAPPEAFTTFAASFDLSYTDPSEGTGSGGPADGISFSFGAAPAANTFGGASGANAENGVPGMHRITLNTASFGGSPTFLRYIGPGNTTIASAPIDRFGDAGKVLPITVTLDASGRLRVTYKGEIVIDEDNIGYTHTAGDTFTFAARTGGDRSEQRVDNIRIATGIPGGAPDIGAVESGLAIPGGTVVTSTADTLDGFDNGVSLREAITFAPPGASITFDQPLDGGTITLGGSQILLDKDVTIDASSLTDGISISGNANGNGTLDPGESRIFEVPSGKTVVLRRLRMVNGQVATSNNNDGTERGGAIRNQGILTVERCEITNSRAFAGGGISNEGGTVILTQSTVSGNSGGQLGGGIRNLSGMFTVDSSTVANNSSNTGGGIFNDDTLLVNQSTLADNSANFTADGIDSQTNPVELRNSIVDGIQGGAITLTGSNLTTGDPLLAPLGDYGGPTPTMPPLPGSPAIDAAVGSTETTDQRGFPRSSGSAPDIGAVELQQLLVTTAADEDNGNNNPANGTGTSLREAIAHDSPVSAELITFAQTLNGSTIVLGGTQILLDKNLTIDATDLPGGLTINGGNLSRIFEISNATVAMRSLTLTGGKSSNGGGAIQTTFSTLSLDRCTLHGNSASFAGGAIHQFTTTGIGGLTLTNCTVANNTVTGTSGRGAGISNINSTLALEHCTIANNSATGSGSQGGGVFHDSGSNTLSLEDTIVAANIADTAADIFRFQFTIGLIGKNLIGNNESTFVPVGPFVGTPATPLDPKLAPLGDYGGPTFTMPPLPGSPAIDAAPGSPEPTDQRGFSRPVDGDGNTTAIADIGAAEFTPATDLAAFFGLDTDGDGNPFGLEFALGTDPDVSDPGNPRNLRLLPQPAGPMKLTFGRNQAAQPFMIWRLTRSTTLLPGSFDEIFRYDGPTSTATNTGTNSTINPTSFEITDNSPPPGKAFYRFEAVPAP